MCPRSSRGEPPALWNCNFVRGRDILLLQLSRPTREDIKITTMSCLFIGKSLVHVHLQAPSSSDLDTSSSRGYLSPACGVVRLAEQNHRYSYGAVA